MTELRPTAAPYGLDWLNGDVATLRDEYERQRAKPMPAQAHWMRVCTAHGPIRVLKHCVPDRAEAVIVYFHGGGFIVGSPLTHADITSALCQRTRLAVYSVDYRLAPEHVAPAPIEDGLAVVEHLLALADGPRRIILCGDSAGGAIALATAANLPESARWHVGGVCSFYGAHGLFDTPSLLQDGSRIDGTDSQTVRRYFTLACGNRPNPYGISSLAVPSSTQVYLMAAGADPLRDDTLALAEELDKTKRKVTLDIVEGETHGCLHQSDSSAAASQALDRAAAWIAGIARH